MSTSAVKSDPDSAAQNQAATTTTTSITPITTAASSPVSLPTNMSAGTPVQTYPSPAHAQWAASQMVIDPQLQQQSATTAAATQRPQHAATPQATPTAAQAALAQSYYSYYPQYQYSYLTAAAQQHAASAAHSQTTAATSHAHTQAATQRASFSVTPTPATPAPISAVQGATPAPATATSSIANQANNALDTSDIATLNDALGSAGVDLRAEEESLQRHDLHIPSHLSTTSSIYMQRTYEDRSRKQPIKPMVNTQNLGTTMRTIGAQHKVSRIPEDSVNYLALALRARLQDLITDMIEASRYRKDAQFDRPASMYESLGPGQGDTQTPMWSIAVRSDVAKQLSLLERIERDDEMRIRRERKERLEMAAQHAANLAAQVNGGGLVAPDGSLNPGVANLTGTSTGMGDDLDGGQPKKKKKKDGPGVTARNMSEDVRKKMSNAVATQAAGLGKYSWMTASANATPAPKKSAAASTAAGTPAKDGGPGTSAGSSWARPYVPKKPTAASSATTTTTPNAEEDPNKIVVTMRDAMFVIEKERGHGGGRGSAKGWK